jgi:uncharacterized protein FYDLN
MMWQRPRITIAIESAVNGYLDWMSERWWGGAVHPNVIIAALALVCFSEFRWAWGWIAAAVASFGTIRLCLHWRDRQMIRKIEARICLECGYDLRASPLRCPECGTEVPLPNLRRAELSEGPGRAIGAEPDDRRDRARPF